MAKKPKNFKITQENLNGTIKIWRLDFLNEFEKDSRKPSNVGLKLNENLQKINFYKIISKEDKKKI